MYNFSNPSQHHGINGGPSNSNDNEDSCRILVSNLRGMFGRMVPALTTQCCIYRVPWRLRKLNEAAYTPCAISIGPFHNGKPELQFMEKHKERYLYDFLQHSRLSLENLVAFIKDWEPNVRLSYGETINLSKMELMKMILLDGSFVIEYFLRSYKNTWKDQNDNILYKPWLDNYIVRDLILLENQLPFLVLEKLYDFSFLNHPNDKELPFHQLASYFFTYFNKQSLIMSPQKSILHFTDLIRTFHLPSLPRVEPIHKGNERKQFSCSATELHAAGVHFKFNANNCLFDIQFKPRNGVLQIPHFEIEDRTNSLFRNLMAFEQCHYPYTTSICDYIILMDTLINTEKDVELLVRKGIITNSLGAHDVLATLMNNLGREILQYREESYFCKLTDDLVDYYKKPWNSWKASLKREYLNTPWRIASIVAAFILLVLTFMQTVNSFVSLKGNPK